MKVMSCENVQEFISSLLDREVPAGAEGNVLVHIQSCRECSARYESMQRVKVVMHGMNYAPMPAGLTDKLRVLASHERARRIAHANLAARFREWRSSVQLAFDNMMRPFAVPAAGGLISALLLFTILVPSLSFAHNSFGDELPAALFTYPDGKIVGAIGYIPKIEYANSPISDQDVVLELTIDERGHVADYSVQNGELTPDMESMILFSTFTPATAFGQPTWSKVSVYFHTDSYRVKVIG
jgi:hypothetical protein